MLLKWLVDLPLASITFGLNSFLGTAIEPGLSCRAFGLHSDYGNLGLAGYFSHDWRDSPGQELLTDRIS
jgi:hypothetical protein